MAVNDEERQVSAAVRGAQARHVAQVGRGLEEEGAIRFWAEPYPYIEALAAIGALQSEGVRVFAGPRAWPWAVGRWGGLAEAAAAGWMPEVEGQLGAGRVGQDPIAAAIGAVLAEGKGSVICIFGEDSLRAPGAREAWRWAVEQGLPVIWVWAGGGAPPTHEARVVWGPSGLSTEAMKPGWWRGEGEAAAAWIALAQDGWQEGAGWGALLEAGKMGGEQEAAVRRAVDADRAWLQGEG